MGDWRCDSSGLPGVVPMIREKLKWRTHESESTDAEHRDGLTRNSVEASVMEVERRG